MNWHVFDRAPYELEGEPVKDSFREYNIAWREHLVRRCSGCGAVLERMENRKDRTCRDCFLVSRHKK